MEEKTNPQGKLPWQTPELMEMNMQKIREEEIELFLRQISDEQVFLRMSGSNDPNR